MEKPVKDKINRIRAGAGSHAEFMKKLAEVDEQGQLTEALRREITGGTGIIDTIIHLGGELLGKLKA